MGSGLWGMGNGVWGMGPVGRTDGQMPIWGLPNGQCAAEFKGTVVAVTHDRYFLDNVAGWILELDRGQGIPFEGNYSEWLKAKAKRLEVSRPKQCMLM